MTDTPPSKRRFWQLHLSTLIIAILFSGGYIGLNIRPDDLGTRSFMWLDRSIQTHRLLAYGWPFHYRLTDPDARNAAQEDWIWMPHRPYSMLGDIGVGLAVLVAIAIASEYLIRRRSKP